VVLLVNSGRFSKYARFVSLMHKQARCKDLQGLCHQITRRLMQGHASYVSTYRQRCPHKQQSANQLVAGVASEPLRVRHCYDD
jgi:hypothetical protein